MKIEIKRWTDDKVILSGEYEDLRNCLQRNRTANLTGADLSKIMIPPPMFLLAQWGEVSDALCVDLMRYDAANHPNPEKFIEWAKGGNCPYSDMSILRSAHFTEKRELIPPGFLSLPVKSAYELMQALIAEKGKK